ncbi:hypothetical protein [Streptomyces sp. JJ38]|uniref:hypothetical protein n=1 Tax=Streptomyces sp. JJ38 TaxID=2738128 RepID=UPI001C5A56D3|nr:hypothetical protein [Streptomyces sp. JJ38]MBW1599977.1 hypothetical protein [Streptomyces sp. JJ38]
MTTRLEDVLLVFCVSQNTRQLYDTWRNDPRRRAVAPVVQAHETRVVYDLTSQDIWDVCRRTEHALGEVKRRDAESVRRIVDWHPDFAFTHALHICMERTGRLPAFGEVRDYAMTDELGREMLGEPARRAIAAEVDRGTPEWLVKAAMRWRVGNAYYSFLRETYTIVELRSRGIPLEVHPLADALFRVDAWVGRTALSLRVGNKKFRHGEHDGRKVPPERLLADVVPALGFHTIELGAASEFGVVHLPSSGQLDAAADGLRRAMASASWG